MTGDGVDLEAEKLATAEIKAGSPFSLIWLIPLITAIIGGWLIIKTQMEKGPEITVSFKTAEGIEAGKTRVKFRDVDVGVVKGVQFSDDFTHVVVTAELNKGTETLLHKQTRFWVVRPRLSLSGVSGLNTLVSGAYIQFAQGDGEESRVFTGLDTPPIISPGQAGVEVVLKSEELGSLDIGSPLYYQGLQAGEVLGYELAKDNKSVFIHAFVREPFSGLVSSNSRFWNISGIDISVGADGLNAHMESVKSLLLGGIAFGTPDTLEPASGEVKDLVFTLFKSQSDIRESTLFTRKENIIAFFDGSVRGLEVGAPVEFNGIKVGSVADLSLEFDKSNASFRIPVLLTIELDRFKMRGGEPFIVDTKALFYQMVKKGLRAQLSTGSLLTGKLFVELNIHPGTPIRLLADESYPYAEIPTIPGGLDQITAAVQNILIKLEKVDIEKIGSNLEQTLQGTNNLMNGPELKGAMQALQHTLSKIDRHAGPVAENLDALLSQAEVTLKLLNRQLKSGSSIMQMSEELTDMARSIRALVDMLEQRPDALLFGKPESGE